MVHCGYVRPVLGQCFMAASHIPEADGGVIAAGDEQRKSRMEVHRLDALHVAIVGRLTVRVHVPLLDDADIVRAEHQVVLLRESHTIH